MLHPSKNVASRSHSRRFDKDDSQQNQKLDEMNLDDVLKSAEDHETMASGGDGGTSLGGEGFLAQFAAVSDVKNDMKWEDIIRLRNASVSKRRKRTGGWQRSQSSPASEAESCTGVV